MKRFKELLEEGKDETGMAGLDKEDRDAIKQELAELRKEAGGDKIKLKKLISSRSWPIEPHKIMIYAGLKESLKEDEKSHYEEIRNKSKVGNLQAKLHDLTIQIRKLEAKKDELRNGLKKEMEK